ncbi:hypothetical protein IscW_ISCW007248 [Ixodes scapularis]|uniref:Uncharacterized protein n=1 Tax=Ixodes scapularis TaxID=6945 RepID=B7PVG2_IXOSC|nr:hypothetical protein IscW_ISCW007248 [Ixodes scapularis]|eukprot:XP_002407919.1 hypothetical protein IscW_ISCW007248 [Ixodes scapularis]
MFDHIQSFSTGCLRMLRVHLWCKLLPFCQVFQAENLLHPITIESKGMKMRAKLQQ